MFKSFREKRDDLRIMMQNSPIKSVWIIGNGFDLACGKKTDYLKTGYLNFLGIKFNRDKKSFEFDNNGYLSKKSRESDTPTIKTFKEHIIENIVSKKEKEVEKSEKEEKDIKNNLWGDLEILLGEITKKYNRNEIDDFLRGFNDLHTKMNEYLKEVEKKYEIAISEFSEDKENRKNLKANRENLKKHFENIDIKTTMFLIMNYTENFEKFIKEIYPDYTEDFWMSRIVYVHGKLSENNTVLGVGDPFFHIKNPDFRNQYFKEKFIKTVITEQYSCLQNNLISLTNIRFKKLDVHIFGCSMGASDNMLWYSIFKKSGIVERIVFRILGLKMPKTLPKTTLYNFVWEDEDDYNKSYEDLLKDFEKNSKKLMFNKERSYLRYTKVVIKSHFVLPCLTVSSFIPKYFLLFGFILVLFPPIRSWMFKTITRKIDNGFELVLTGYDPFK